MQTITVIKDESIGTIVLNRPKAMNTLNEMMARELLHAITQLNEDDSVKVIILRGEGPAFMAGGDVSFFHSHLENLSQQIDPIIDNVHKFVLKLVQSQKPVVCAVHGAVAGIGLSFMLAADFVLAAKETKFTTAYAKLGLTADGGCTYFLPRLIGVQKAKALLMLCDIFDTMQADKLGLIYEVCEATSLLPKTMEIAQKLSKGPLAAFAKIKTLVNHASHNDLSEQLELEKQAFKASSETEDFKQGVLAFINKQKPEFTGA